MITEELETAYEDYKLPRALKIGDEVIIRSINKQATVLSIPDKDGNLSVRAGIITTRTNISNLRLKEPPKAGGKSKKSGSSKAPARGAITKTLAGGEFKLRLDLRGMTGDEAWFAVDKYIDEATVANVNSVTLLHGKGTGALRNALWQMLKRDKRVASFRPGEYGEGDYGVTVVEIKAN